MNPEMPTERGFSPEGQEEIIINDVERCVLDGQKQLEALSEDQREILERMKNEKFEPLWSQIERKLAA